MKHALVGLVVGAAVFAGCSVEQELGLESCIQNAFGAEFCGQDAVNFCNQTESLRKGEPSLGIPADRQSEQVCDEVRASEGGY